MLQGEGFSRTDDDDDNEEPETDTPGFGSLCMLTSEPTFVITESLSASDDVSFSSDEDSETASSTSSELSVSEPESLLKRGDNASATSEESVCVWESLHV